MEDETFADVTLDKIDVVLLVKVVLARTDDADDDESGDVVV